MKLYATTTSERATKGQGGNEYLDIFINLYNDDRYSIKVTPEKLVFRERGYDTPLLERHHRDIIEMEERRLKYIKEQKEERFCLCENSNIDKDGFCEECGKKYNGKSQKGEKCASGHTQDEDGRCPCVNKDAY